MSETEMQLWRQLLKGEYDHVICWEIYSFFQKTNSYIINSIVLIISLMPVYSMLVLTCINFSDVTTKEQASAAHMKELTEGG